jgi:hypothetical protein
MDAPPEATQHDDVVVHAAHQLNASIERVRQARRLLYEASDHLTLTRQEVEKDPRLERVRRACGLLDAANHRLAQTRQQVEDAHHPNAVSSATDD